MAGVFYHHKAFQGVPLPCGATQGFLFPINVPEGKGQGLGFGAKGQPSLDPTPSIRRLFAGLNNLNLKQPSDGAWSIESVSNM
jgi:hypothetical protein